MLLVLSTTYRPATDLGFLLHKHPERFQTFDLSFGKAHVLPCIPSLIQLQEPYTGRIMSRRRATSGMWDTYSISPVRLSTSGTKPGDGLGLGEGDSHRQTP